MLILFDHIRIPSRNQRPIKISFYFLCITLCVLLCDVRKINGLKCVCNPDECDVIRPQECPGRGYIVWDPCKCCKVCAKTFGEACGGLGGFSGTCEPPLQCVVKPPVTGTGVCLDLKISTRKKMDCHQTMYLESGCEIVNRKCRCWSRTKICKDDTMDQRPWDFNTMEDCQLNLQNLVKAEIEFDEDYTVTPKKLEFKCPAELQCPPIRSKICPPDSNLEIIFNQFYVDNKKIEVKVQNNDTLEGLKIITDDKAMENNTSDLDIDQHHEVKQINHTYDKLISQCCPYTKCVCKPECDVPICQNNEVPIASKLGLGYEGSCCAIYKCQPKPICTDLFDYKWYQPCLECRCTKGHYICIDICDKHEEKMLGCRVLFRHYEHGEKWKENDDCTECECINGQHKCIATMCKTISCSKQIKLPGQCCPICENEDMTLEYCVGSEDCDSGDLVCPIGYHLDVVHPNGCLQCRCIRQQNQTITATTLSTINAISVTPDHYNNMNTTINATTDNIIDNKDFETSTENPVSSTTIKQIQIHNISNNNHIFNQTLNSENSTILIFSCENHKIFNICINKTLIISIIAIIMLLLILLFYSIYIRRQKLNNNLYKAVSPAQN